MSNAKTLLVMLLAGTIAGEVSARETTAGEERRAAEAERKVVDVEAEMRAAEARLEEAARRIAELSTRRLPRIDARRFGFEFGRPMLGITIGGESDDGPVEGVVVRGVTPGGPAVEAGLRAGDVITAVNDESLAADSSAAATRKLLDFMAGVEEGDTLDVEYLRDGTVAEVTLEPEARSPRMLSFGMPEAPRAPHAPVAPGFSRFMFFGGRGGWGDMEMVPLTEDLGRYFGTDKGLLVVRAPSDDALQLKDGDVIHAIDGREPASVSHAVRILGSYQSGETLKIEIMRDKRRQTLDVEMPDDRSSRLGACAVETDEERVTHVESDCWIPAADRVRAVRAAPGMRISTERGVEAR